MTVSLIPADVLGFIRSCDPGSAQPEPNPQPTAAEIAQSLRVDLRNDLNWLPLSLADAMELPNPPAAAWDALRAWQAAEAAVLTLAAALEVA